MPANFVFPTLTPATLAAVTGGDYAQRAADRDCANKVLGQDSWCDANYMWPGTGGSDSGTTTGSSWRMPLGYLLR